MEPILLRTANTPFIGREAELTALRQRLESARSAQGGVVLISGEPGIGKTRVLTEFAEIARSDGWLVLASRIYDMEGMPPYIAFAEAIKSFVAGVPDVNRNVLFEHASAQLAVLIPSFQQGTTRATSPRASGPEVDRYQLFEAVSDFLLNLSTALKAPGLVFCLDDIHYADKSTLQLFLHLARKIAGSPMLVVASYRTDQASRSQPLFAVLAELSRARLSERMQLNPLTPAHTGSLIKGVTGVTPSRIVADAIHERTRGNPFFVEEIAQELAACGRDLTTSLSFDLPISEGVQQVIGQRLSHVGGNTTKFLEAAAVLGQGFGPELAGSVAGLKSSVVPAAVEDALDNGILRENGTEYVFSHPLIREVIYGGLSSPRRQRLHHQAAQAIEAIYGPNLEPHCALLATHYRQAGAANSKKAIEYALRAGEAAQRVMAWREAVQHWEAAFEFMARGQAHPAATALLAEGLAEMCFLDDLEVAKSIEWLEQARQAYLLLKDEVGVARMEARIGRSYSWNTRSANYLFSQEHLRRAEIVLRNQPATVELGELYASFAYAGFFALNLKEGAAAARQMAEIAARLDNAPLRMHADLVLGYLLACGGRVEEGKDLLEKSWQAAERLPDIFPNDWNQDWPDLLASFNPLNPLAGIDRHGSWQGCRELNSNAARRRAAIWCAHLATELGDPQAAVHWLNKLPADRLKGLFYIPNCFAESGDRLALNRLAPQLDERGFGAAEAWCDGRWPEVQATWRAYTDQRRLVGDNWAYMYCTRWVARALRAAGQADEAKSVLEECLETAVTGEVVFYELPVRAELALLAAEASEGDLALAHLTRCREILAIKDGWQRGAGRVALSEATLAAVQGLHHMATTHFEQAIECFRSLSLPWDEAEALETWARSCAKFHRGQRRRDFVAATMGSARKVYERIGAGQPWIERLEAESGRLVGPVSTSNDLYPDGLTSREVEILRLIASGRSNREIAQELVLSERTVERHITNIYSKIGARGKADATAYALNHSLT